MVEHQRLVVEHAVTAAELVDPANDGVVPQKINLRPRRREGLGNDVFLVVRREMSESGWGGHDKINIVNPGRSRQWTVPDRICVYIWPLLFAVFFHVVEQ
jgi:hypothetical protein